MKQRKIRRKQRKKLGFTPLSKENENQLNSMKVDERKRNKELFKNDLAINGGTLLPMKKNVRLHLLYFVRYPIFLQEISK